MNFTYTTISGTPCIVRSDGAFIPADLNNADYQAYMAWVAAGNVAPPSGLQTAQVAVLKQDS